MFSDSASRWSRSTSSKCAKEKIMEKMNMIRLAVKIMVFILLLVLATPVY
jgi:hypothetical protein